MAARAGEMSSRQACEITDAIGIAPGLITITGRPGEVSLEVFGRRDLEQWNTTLPGDEPNTALATQRALGLAMMHGLPILIRFISKGAH
ncbi:MAG: hypothetical protein JY451_01685 [Erythrobacter sp.]|nr:MAG: hypothetical protein JY451_01685 [Erythrobacter sp.]